MTKGIDIAFFRNLVEPDSFFGQKTGRVLILLRPSEIDRPMSRVHITTKNHRFALRTQSVTKRQKVSFVLHFVGNTMVIAAAVGEVGGDEDEIAVIGDDGAPFAVKLVAAEANLDGNGFGFSEESDTTVATFFGRSPIRVISRWREQRVVELIRVCFGFLNAQNVRLRRRQPVEKPFFLCGANAVDIPTVKCVHDAILPPPSSVQQIFRVYVFSQPFVKYIQMGVVAAITVAARIASHVGHVADVAFLTDGLTELHRVAD